MQDLLIQMVPSRHTEFNLDDILEIFLKYF